MNTPTGSAKQRASEFDQVRRCVNNPVQVWYCTQCHEPHCPDCGACCTTIGQVVTCTSCWSEFLYPPRESS